MATKDSKRKKRAKIDKELIFQLVRGTTSCGISEDDREKVLKRYRSPKGYGKPNPASIKKVIRDVVREIEKGKQSRYEPHQMPGPNPSFKSLKKQWQPNKPQSIELGANLRKLVGIYVEELDGHYAKMKVLEEKQGEMKERIEELKMRIRTIEETVDDPRTLKIGKWLKESVF